MTKEELDKKIAEARKNPEVLTQEQIDELLKAIAEGEEDYSPVNAARKIKIYDFKRPDKFSREELRDISNASEIVAENFKKFLITEYGINAKINVESVDELTCEEFIRSIPTPIPHCTFNWMDGAGIFSLWPSIFFKGFLGSNCKKNHNPNGLETKIFVEYFSNPFEKILHSTFSTIANKNLPEISNSKYASNPMFTSSTIWPTEMGVLITFKAKVGQIQDYINLFFNADCLEALRDSTFFPRPNSVTIVPVTYPKPNTIIEIGRFRLEDGDILKEKYVYETNKLAGLPLNVYKNNVYVGAGDAVVIDDNSGIRIVTKPDELEAHKDDDFYNTKVIFGGRITDDDFEFDEGCILELDEYIFDPVKIVKDGKTIGRGEVVVVGESFAVKVTKVEE